MSASWAAPASGQQVLAAGLVDELRIHVAPVLFGAGTRLFEEHGDAHVALQRTSVVETPAAPHLPRAPLTRR